MQKKKKTSYPIHTGLDSRERIERLMFAFDTSKGQYNYEQEKSFNLITAPPSFATTTSQILWVLIFFAKNNNFDPLSKRSFVLTSSPM